MAILWQWHKRIPWYEEIYSVSKFGKVYSYYKRSNRWAILCNEPQAEVKPRKNKAGVNSNSKVRPQVTLYKKWTKKKMFVSRLIAWIFLWYDMDSKLQVIHIDWDNFNNDVDNLKVGTVSERASNWHKHKKKVFK